MPCDDVHLMMRQHVGQTAKPHQESVLVAATIEAVRMRLRPILMTSFAFGLGVFPLALSTGAGAAGRVAVGTIVLGGVMAATLFSIFFAPLFYVVIRKLTGGRPPAPKASAEEVA